MPGLSIYRGSRASARGYYLKGSKAAALSNIPPHAGATRELAENLEELVRRIIGSERNEKEMHMARKYELEDKLYRAEGTARMISWPI